jgi:membrane protein YqaA with SNARE-associated domain
VSGALIGHFLLIAGSFGFGVASALVPIINAEAYVLAVCATASPWPASLAMVALVVGTLGGKLVLFLGARHRDKLGRFMRRHGDAVDAAQRGVAAEIAHAEAVLEQARARAEAPNDTATKVEERRWGWLPPSPPWLRRIKQAIAAWGDRALGLLDKPWESAGVLMASATLGVPPLAITTIAAGLRKTSLPIFIICVILGRAIRFAIIAVPTLVARN